MVPSAKCNRLISRRSFAFNEWMRTAGTGPISPVGLRIAYVPPAPV